MTGGGEDSFRAGGAAGAPAAGDDGTPRIPGDVARRIRLAVFDVDGVLTDAGVYLGRLAGGEEVELKRFDIQDGLGLKFLQWAGLEVALVSGRVSEATELRARELDIHECHQAPGAEKMPVFLDLLGRKGVQWNEVAMVADDLPDMAAFTRVGLPVAVANAQPEIREQAVWTTRAAGGRGAVREFCRELLRARGQWDEVVRSYVSDRGGVA